MLRLSGALIFLLLLPAWGGAAEPEAPETPPPAWVYLDDDETRRIEDETRGILGPTFRVVRTSHFLIRTDTPAPYARETAALLEGHLAAFYARFGDALSIGELRTDRRDLSVLLFAERAAFDAHVRLKPPSFTDPAQGFYEPSTGSLVLYREFHGGREVTRLKLLHEGAHQLWHLAAGLYATSSTRIWLVEGLAAYAEGAVPGKDGNLELGGIEPNRLATLQAALEAEEATPVNVLVTLDQRLFVGDGGLRGNLHYAQAWGLVQFLLHGGGEARREAFFPFLRRALRGGGNEEDFRVVNGGEPVAFEQAFRDYILSLRPGSTSER